MVDDDAIWITEVSSEETEDFVVEETEEETVSFGPSFLIFVHVLRKQCLAGDLGEDEDEVVYSLMEIGISEESARDFYNEVMN